MLITNIVVTTLGQAVNNCRADNSKHKLELIAVLCITVE
jgi:hypothetical protein